MVDPRDRDELLDEMANRLNRMTPESATALLAHFPRWFDAMLVANGDEPDDHDDGRAWIAFGLEVRAAGRELPSAPPR